jgi:alpha-galactosidase
MKQPAAAIALAIVITTSFLTGSFADEGKPVKVFILAGQSNMEGKAPNTLLDYQAEDPKTKDLFKHLRKDGKWIVRDDVFIKFLDRKGPLTIGYGSPGRTGVELEFGTMMGNHFNKPVLLIKAAWGGHSLVKLFRSSSAGYPEDAVLQKELEQARDRVRKDNEKQRKHNPLPTMDDIKKDYGSSYRNMLAEVKETFDNYETMFPALKGKKLELTGFVWFQGWNDQYGGAEKEYASNMKHFIKDVRKDLGAPHLPFVIAAMGQNGSKPATGAMLTIREAQMSMNDVPEFRGNVKAFRTDLLVDKAAEELYPTWQKNIEQWNKVGGDHGYHYLGSAIWFTRIGHAMGEAMLELMKTQLAPGARCIAEGEWTRFRGPNGSGISDATTVPTRWSEKDYNWKVKLPGVGHSSPVIWGRRIFVTSGDLESGKRSVCCLDVADGHTLWQRDYPSKTDTQHPDNAYATSTPAVDDDGVVVTWATPDEVTLLALDNAGHETWRRNLGPFVAFFGSGSSPILFDNLVVLSNDQEDPSLLPGHKQNPLEPVGKSCLVALDRKTGQTRWQIDRRTLFSSYSTPCVYRDEGVAPMLIFSTAAHGIMAVDPRQGKVIWEFGQPFLDRVLSSPVVARGLVIAGHGAGTRASRYVAVRPGSPEKGSKPILAYEVKKSIPLIPTPLAKDNRLYFWTDDGVVSCLRLDTAEVLWEESVGGAYYASPVWVNHCLYGVAKNGHVVVLAAADKFEVLGRMSLGEMSYATPAVAGGVMYLRTRSHLFSLGGAGKNAGGSSGF